VLKDKLDAQAMATALNVYATNASLGGSAAAGYGFNVSQYGLGDSSWNIGSDTVEAHWRVELKRGIYLEPHARWYRQNAADFYNLYVSDASAIPSDMSADPRLAAFVATTYGVKFGVHAGRAGELSLRLEEYQQKPHVRSSSLPELQGLDLNPTLKAFIVQLGWHFELW